MVAAGVLVTVAVDVRGSPPIHTVATGWRSRFLTQSLFARTVDTVTVSPERHPSNGTRRGTPERRPIVSTTTAPGPWIGDPTPRLTAGST